MQFDQIPTVPRLDLIQRLETLQDKVRVLRAEQEAVSESIGKIINELWRTRLEDSDNTSMLK